MRTSSINRRDFLTAGGGIVIALALGGNASRTGAAAVYGGGSLATNKMLDAWLRIGADGIVTVMSGKVEFGQGILTAIAQIAADELDVAMTRLQIISGDTAVCPDEGWTAGSRSIEESGMAVRYAAAEARQILLTMAATALAVRFEELRVADGRIVSVDGRAVTYWELAARNPLHKAASLTVAPKERAERTLTGRSVPRRDLPGKFSGVPSYLHDMHMAGMLHGRVVRPPALGSQLLSLEEKEAREQAGVVAVVRQGSFVGVIAEREETAIAAANALRRGASWSEPPLLPFDDQNVVGRLRELPNTTIELASAKPLVQVASRLRATYTKPFIAHASLGPSAAVATQDGDNLSVWTHSQAVNPLRRVLSKITGVALQRLRVRHAEGAGCYGQNGADDVALDAALLARAVPGRPVRVQWMRDDEFLWEPYGSAMRMQVECGLDASGLIVDWNYDFWTGTHAERPDLPSGTPNMVAAWHLPKPVDRPDGLEGPLPTGGGSRNAIPLYSFASHRITEHLIKRMPLRTSSLRGLGAYANIFAIESMMDEAAAAVRADPLEFRLRHTADERAKRVMRVAAEAARWQSGHRGDGQRGQGISFGRYKSVGAYVAMVAEVEVDRTSGQIRASKITAAIDAGEIINPDGFKNQVEGGIVQALSWTLKEQIRFNPRQITTRSWREYPILTFSEVPTIDVHIIESHGQPPMGAGEPSLPPVGAAVANAVASATGVRLRELPLSPDRVLAALARSSL